MNSNQAKKFMDAVKAANIKSYQFDTDLGTHLYHDGVRAIARPLYDLEAVISYRAMSGGSTPVYGNNIQVITSDFGDIHECRLAGSLEQIKKFAAEYGDTLSNDDLKILLQIDSTNVNIKPETGDYVNGFKYLTAKQISQLSPEEKADYEAELAEHEKSVREYIAPNQAASITL